MKSMTKLLCLVLCFVMIGSCFIACDLEETSNSNQSNGEQSAQSQSDEEQSNTPSNTTEWTVTFDANGGAFENGETTQTQTVAQGTRLTVPQTPRRTGYTFSGWSINQNTSEPWDFANATVNRAITLYATWTARTANILSVEGATIDGTEIFLLVDSTTTNVSLAEKVVCSEGCAWRLYYDQMGQTEIPTKIAAGMNGELSNGENVFYIVVNSLDGTMTSVYKLTVYRNYAVAVEYYHQNQLIHTETAYTGNEFSITYIPDIQGFTFHHWNDVDGTPCDRITPWDTVRLFADATANTYEITYNANNGSLNETGSTVTFGEHFSFPIPTRTGYTFEGWYYGSTQLTDSNGASINLWGITDNIEITASWSVHTHNVVLNNTDTNAGSLQGAGRYSYGANVTITATINDGYNFLGWYDGDTLITENTSYSFTLGDESVTFTAKWSYYTVTTEMNMAGGNITYYSNKKVSVGQTVTVTAESCLGYKFLGWYKGGALISEELSYSFAMPTENMTLTATWEILPEMQPFNFTSTPTTCKITSVKTLEATTLVVPNFVTSIQRGAFFGCSKLQSLTIPFVGESRKTETDLYQYPLGYIFGTTQYTNSASAQQSYYGNSTSTTTYTTYYIPTSLKSVTVTGGNILRGAFEDCTTLTTITLPNNITNISDNAFHRCINLTTITIPNSVLSIGGAAFMDCHHLTSITIPENVTSIGDSAFENCDKLKSFTIPNSVTSIGERLFWDCDSLANIVIGNGVTSIGDTAFSSCDSLTNIVLPNNVISIGNSAFSLCYNLTSITIGDRLTSIGEGAFDCCYKLVEVIDHSSLSLTIGSEEYGKIAHFAKEIHTGESKIDNQNGVLFYTYNEVNYLLGYIGTETELTLPQNYNGEVYEIYPYAFYENKYLTGITISSNTTNIGEYSFYNCDSLITLTIQDGTMKIGAYAFADCAQLTTVTIGNGVTDIAEYAFCWDNAITSIEIPGSVATIGASAFHQCSGLTSIILHDGVTTIGESAFSWGGAGVTELVIPNSVTSIGYGAFFGFIQLESITIPFVGATKDGTSNTHFGYIFGASSYSYNDDYVPSSLKTVVITGGEIISSSAFYNCSSLTSITIPDCVTNIDSFAFKNCSSLTSVTIGNGVTSIGSFAFYDCSRLTDIYFTGTEEEWNAIEKSYAEIPSSATIHFEYVPNES